MFEADAFERGGGGDGREKYLTEVDHDDSVNFAFFLSDELEDSEGEKEGGGRWKVDELLFS